MRALFGAALAAILLTATPATARPIPDGGVTKNRFGRAFLDAENDPIVEMDMDTEKGYTTEAISNNLATWLAVLSKFTAFFDL